MNENWWIGDRPDTILTPDATHSQLFDALCALGSDGACTFPMEVVLPQHLACHDAPTILFTEYDVYNEPVVMNRSNECEVDEPRVIRLIDPSSGAVAFYEYERPACTELTFFNGGRQVQRGPHLLCSDPATIGAATSCCKASNSNAYMECQFFGERVKYSTAVERCAIGSTHPYFRPGENDLARASELFRELLTAQEATLGSQVCDMTVHNAWRGVTPSEGCASGNASCCTPGASCTSIRGTTYCGGTEVWLGTPCELQIQVDAAHGEISTHAPDLHMLSYKKGVGCSDPTQLYGLDSGNTFRVHWAGGSYPTPPECAAASACTVHSSSMGVSSCVCAVHVVTSAVFDAIDGVPSAADVETALTIAAPPLEMYDPDEYRLCHSAACTAAAPEVLVYLHNTTFATGGFNEQTVFRIVLNDTRHVYLLNRLSTVEVSGTNFSFRNPPHFMRWAEQSTRDAQHETDALIDSLVYHQNTPAHTATRLIQKLVTSNPSPRYVKRVADAFHTGTCAGHVYSGSYGDLGATVACALLDREARSTTLDASPTHGHLREPFLQVMNVLRSLEFASKDGRQVQLLNLDQIGQEPFRAASVFGFYSPEYRAPGAVAQSRQLSPEAEVTAQGDYYIAKFNGLFSLVEYGLSACKGGFGLPMTYHSDDQCDRYKGSTYAVDHAGQLSWRPSSTHGPDVLDELALLLTGGRLGANTRAVVLSAYEQEASARGHTSALKLAEKLVLASAEFHATNANALPPLPPSPPSPPSLPPSDPAPSSPPTTPPTSPQPPLQPAWVQSNLGAGSNDEEPECPGGYERITSEEECQEAAEALNGPDWFHSARSWTDWPQACFITPGGGGRVFFNEILDESAIDCDSGRHCRAADTICKRALPPPPPLPPAAPSPPPAPPPGGDDYKAVIVIQLFGGLDSFNMLVPHSLCDAAAGGYAEYLQARGGLFTGREDSGVALRQDTLQQIAAGASSKPQPCDVMGLHPKLVKTKAMYESGDAAIYANVGALIEHLTPDEFFGGDGRKEVPDALFSHNVQDRFMQTLSNNQFEPGILGKVMRALDTPACDAYGSTSAGSARTYYKTGLYAMHSGSARALEGGPVLPLSIDSRRADIRRLSEYEQLWPHIENLTAAPSRSVFAETHSRVLGRAIQDAETLGDAIDAAATTTTFNDCCDGGSCGCSFAMALRTIARVIKTRSATGVQRAAFWMGTRGLDAHASMDSPGDGITSMIDNAVDDFRKEMVEQGLWDKVTVITLSEFGRTITSNGRGTTHAWGGNQLMFGGAVNGSRILGQYPSKLGPDGDRTRNDRGTIVPTEPWESMWQPIAQWMGVAPCDLPKVMPNLPNFPDAGEGRVLRVEDVYEAGAVA